LGARASEPISGNDALELSEEVIFNLLLALIELAVVDES
jgi:hypothetical protein